MKKQPIAFGKYYLLDRINIGGMAEVYKAKTIGVEGFEKVVAIKRILPNIAEDSEFITMFIDEAKISVQLTHANIAQIYDLGKINDSYFIAMEYVPGKDVRSIFDRARRKGEPIPIPMTCFIISKLCEGLDYAHRKKDAAGRDLNIVHRDISPQNCLLSFEGEVKLIDFGIAKAANKASKTQAGILKGKFGYMSPEQVRGLPLDRRSDVFAVGVCLYELLTGERLFVGESDFSTLEKVRNVDILPPTTYNRRIPEPLEKIVLKALAKDVEDRYQWANELQDDLQKFLIVSESIFSRKDLAAYMKATFAEDLEREKMKMAEAAEFKLPTAAPQPPPRAPSRPAAPAPDTYPNAETADKTHLFAEGDGLFEDGEEPRTAPGMPPAPPPPLPPPSRAPSGALRRPGDPLPNIVSRTSPEIPRNGGTPLPGPGRVPSGRIPRPPPNSGALPRPRTESGGIPRPPPRALAPEDLESTESGVDEAPSGKKWVLPVALLGAVVAIGLAGGGWLFTHRTADVTGTLVVASDPLDVEYLVDGQKVADSGPLTRKLAPGDHKLELHKDGYKPIEKTVTIAPGKIENVVVQLEKIAVAATANVAVFTNPNDAAIIVDNKTMRERGAKDQGWFGQVDADKPHTVVVRAPGYADFTQQFTPPAGANQRIDAVLQKLAATLRITSVPAGATVIIDGKNRGRTGAAPLEIDDLDPTANHTLLLRKRCFEDYPSTVVFEGAVKEVSPRLTPKPGCAGD